MLGVMTAGWTDGFSTFATGATRALAALAPFGEGAAPEPRQVLVAVRSPRSAAFDRLWRDCLAFCEPGPALAGSTLCSSDWPRT